MILQDAGQLSISDPVSKYIPAFKDVRLESGQPPAHEITIRDVLTHTSGLGGSQQTEGTLEETVNALAQRRLSFEPGAKWQYSPGLSVGGRIVEVVSGQAFEDFLAEKVFRPLAMQDTTFRPSAEQQERLARLYERSEAGELRPGRHWLVDFEGNRTPNPSGGLFSTAADMARFYQMILNGGELDGRRIVSAESVKEMTTIQTGALETGFTPGNGWGLGWCVIREPQGVTRMLSSGTFGHGGAFGTQGWVDPQRELILVLLVQRTNLGNSDASQLRDAFQELAVRAVR
jgi:CubicO group peptidase (beta-lactamase class C family)